MTARLRRFLHVVAADLLYYFGLLRVWQFLRRVFHRKEICVLGLHRVLTEEEKCRTNSLESMVLREATFVRLLEDLRRRFEIISLETFLEHRSKNIGRSKPWCLLTFDDGWKDTYTRAYPWLKKFQIPATVFLTTGSIEGRRGFWVEQLKRTWKGSASRERLKSHLLGVVPKGQPLELEAIVEWLKHMSADKRRPLLEPLLPAGQHADGPDDVDSMLTWNEIMEMGRDGIEFGAHTVSHLLLPYEDDATVERELRTSKQLLEDKLDKRVCAFAYPNGDWDERIRKWVERAGYRCAFTTQPGWHAPGQDTYTIRRILLHEGNVTAGKGQFSAAMLSLTLAGWH